MRGSTPEAMARMRMFRGPAIATVHLYRGSPCTRSWSQFQKTVEEWTLCGIRQGTEHAKKSDDPALTTCEFCRQLADLDPVRTGPSLLKKTISEPREALPHQEAA